MTVICEECGKVYHLDPEKVEQYRGREIKVRCGECGHVTRLSKLIETEEEPAEEFHETDSYEDFQELETPGAETSPESEIQDAPVAETRTESAFPEPPASRSTGFLGLRGKMVILFLLIPILILAGTGVFYQLQLRQLGDEITAQSTSIVLEEGKNRIMQKARDVALQCEIYLQAHPGLEREDFGFDPEFSGIAVQNVGKTGYTALIQEAEPGKGRDWSIWAHPNPNMVGLGDPEVLRKALGPFFDPFWDIITAAADRNESEGFYKWKDADGKIRRKYAALTPIHIEGKPFLLMATAYVDEFTKRTDDLSASAAAMTRNARNISFGILIGAIVLIGLCISIYGHRLTRRITYLTEAAERISVGDLEAEIEIKSKDEIGTLADAISRMQDSLRFSIERLRRRRH